MSNDNLPDLSLAKPLSLPPTQDHIQRWTSAVAQGVRESLVPHVSYAVGLSLLPTEQGLMPGVAVVLTMPGPIIGQPMQSMWVGVNIAEPLESIKAQTTSTVIEMEQARLQAISQQN